jgi:pilus assembly protein Flp/PilA
MGPLLAPSDLPGYPIWTYGLVLLVLTPSKKKNGLFSQSLFFANAKVQNYETLGIRAQTGRVVLLQNRVEFHMNSIAAFLKSDSGATAIEYGLIAAGISVAIIAVLNGVGTQLNSTFTSVKNSIAGQ